jgi:transposase InsO family protein
MAALTRRQEDYLNEIYTDPRHPASFQGPDAVFRAVRREGTHRITFNNIKRWVQNKEAYSKNRKLRMQFQRNRVIIAGIDDQWDVDLAVLTSFKEDNDGVAYLLCAIDIFSRFAWVKMLKNKSAPSVVEGFQEILGEGRKPDRLRSDAATDFTSRLFQNMCKDEGIRHFTTHGEKQANYVERFIQTLKTRLFRYMVEKNDPKYIDILPGLVDAYNNTYHNGIQEIPSAVNKENEKRLWWQMYLPDAFYKPAHQVPKPRKPKFKYPIGQHVRISFTASGFNRQYEQKWSTEVFVIVDRFPREGLPIYLLENTLGEKIQGTFYEQELQPIDFDPDAAFKIDQLLKYKGRGRNRQVLVSWLGWPKQYNSWIPVSEIQDL